MSFLKRLLTSTRFWTAFIGLAAVIAVQLGVVQEEADKLSAAILGVITILLGSYSIRRAGE